jgi:hypothetical protein
VKKAVFLWVLLKITLKNKTMPLQHYFPSLKKIVILFLMLTIVVPASFASFPKKAEAVPVIVAYDWIEYLDLGEAFTQTIKQIQILAEDVIQTAKLTYLALKESVLDPIARLLGAQLANQLVNQMFSFVATGNNGAPSFVTNPQQYFGGVAEESTQVFLTDLQNNRPDRMASINNAVRQRIIEENYVDSKRMEQSTFPGGDAGYQAYLENQSSCQTGNSWDCYFASLEPQNNTWDVYNAERAKLAAGRSADVKLAQDEVLAGAGFHTLKSCIEKDVNANCTEYLNKTPGDTIARQTNEYLTSQLRQIEQADEVDEVISVGISLVQKFMSSKGLTGLAG